MKSHHFLCAALAASIPSLVCAQSKSNEPDYQKFAVEPGAQLEVWSWVVGLDSIAKDFEKEFPNIKVKVDNIGGGPTEYQKLQTAIKAGSGAPDAAQIEFDFLPSFIVTDGLADLTPFGAEQAKSYFVGWTWGQVSPDGKVVYGIPQDIGPLALMYNKKTFDKYQITVPKTWDEFAAQAEKLSKASQGKVKIANFFADYAPWFIGLAWAADAKFFKTSGDTWSQALNNPIAEKVLSYWSDLVKKGYASTYKGFTPELYNAFANGEIAASIEAAWGPGVMAASLKERTAGDWRVAPLPQWNAAEAKSGNWGGSAFVVTKQSKFPKAATLFNIWLNTHKSAVLDNWYNTGIFPASTQGLADPELNRPDKDPAKFCGGQNVVQVYADAAKGVDVDFLWSPWFAFANDNYNKQMSDLVTGKFTPKQALDAWQADCLKNAKDQGFEVKSQ